MVVLQDQKLSGTLCSQAWTLVTRRGHGQGLHSEFWGWRVCGFSPRLRAYFPKAEAPSQPPRALRGTFYCG